MKKIKKPHRNTCAFFGDKEEVMEALVLWMRRGGKWNACELSLAPRYSMTTTLARRAASECVTCSLRVQFEGDLKEPIAQRVSVNEDKERDQMQR